LVNVSNYNFAFVVQTVTGRKWKVGILHENQKCVKKLSNPACYSVSELLKYARIELVLIFVVRKRSEFFGCLNLTV